MYVKSATHVRFGPVAVKSRLTRSGDAIGSLPGIVVLHGFPRRVKDGENSPVAMMGIPHFVGGR
jgi:hypothetical protein